MPHNTIILINIDESTVTLKDLVLLRVIENLVKNEMDGIQL